MTRAITSLGLIILLATLCFQVGCGQIEENPVAPQTEQLAQNGPLENGAVIVSFRFVPPPSNQTSPNAAIVAATGVTPQVTFKLTLINLGNTANPTTVLSKTVPSVNGVASASFQAIPIRTCIGDVHIEGGKIGSYFDFHGALDLKLGSNTLLLAGKGSRETPDFVAYVIEKILTTPGMSAKIVSNMAEKLANSLLSLNTGLPNAYDEAVKMFTAFDGIIPWLTHVNYYRALATLPPVTEDSALSSDCNKHSYYMVKTNTLQHDEDPANPFFTTEGQNAAKNSNLFASYNYRDGSAYAIDGWMQAPFHAVGILDPKLITTGFGLWDFKRRKIEFPDGSGY